MKKFILGVLFGVVALPVLDCVVSIIQQATQLEKTKLATKTVKVQSEYEEEPQEKPTKYAIGFVAPNSEECDEEEEEE